MVEIDPWGSGTVEDYSELFQEFGIEKFNPENIPEPMDLMRRGIIFGQRDYDLITHAMKNNEDFAALSGFMPSGRVHIGNLMVMRELIWHQQQGAETYFVIADLEAHSARGMSWEKCEKLSMDYILSMIALGFDPESGHIYRQSENQELKDLQFELGEQTNFNELNAIYGFNEETNMGHIQSVLTQSADILYPQLEEPKPTVIPVGADQDPHLRLTRGLARRMRLFSVKESYASFEIPDRYKPSINQVLQSHNGKIKSKKAAKQLEKQGADNELINALKSGGSEELEPRIRVLSRRASPELFSELGSRLQNVGRVETYDEHFDIFDGDEQEIKKIVRDTEVEHGGYGFYMPSSIYHRFMTGLTGGKMSSSIPKSHIALTDEPSDGREKVMSATTGGRETAEKQRELGGEADECPVYELYAYMLAQDDEHAKKVYDECVGGDRLCGGCKSEAAELMQDFLEKHREKREEARDRLHEFGLEPI